MNTDSEFIIHFKADINVKEAMRNQKFKPKNDADRRVDEILAKVEKMLEKLG